MPITLKSKTLPPSMVPMARQLHSLLLGNLGEWELRYDGAVAYVTSSVVSEYVEEVTIRVAAPVAAFLAGRTRIKLDDMTLHLERPPLGVLGSSVIVRAGVLPTPAIRVEVDKAPDPLIKSLTADKDGNFTLLLRTIAGVEVVKRILLE